MEENDRLYVGRCRDRAIAAILGYRDREVSHLLPPEINAKLRKVILDEINEFCDEVLDCMSENPGLNQFYLDQIEEIYEAVVKNGRL